MSANLVGASPRVVQQERSSAQNTSNNYKQTDRPSDRSESIYGEDEPDNLSGAKNLVSPQVTETLTKRQIIEKKEAENEKLKKELAETKKKLNESENKVTGLKGKLFDEKEDNEKMLKELGDVKKDNDKLAKAVNRQKAEEEEEEDNAEDFELESGPKPAQAQALIVSPKRSQGPVPPLHGGRVKTLFERFSQRLSKIGQFCRKNIVQIGTVLTVGCCITAEILRGTGHPVGAVIAVAFSGAGAIATAAAAVCDRKWNQKKFA